MIDFNPKNIFSFRTTSALVVVCVLASIFIPVIGLKALSPSLSIVKSVDKNFAFPGDEIVYTLNYSNNGQGTATGVIIRDPFTDLNQHYLTFISANPSPNIGNDTWIIDSLEYGQSGKITIRAKISQSILLSALEIRNRANIGSNETYAKYSNYASVFISITPGLRIDKWVRNVSKGSNFSPMVIADPGDEIEFSLEVKSTFTSRIFNVKVWDNLPSLLSYISGSTKVNESYNSDGIAGDGIYIGDINLNETKIVKFKATIASGEKFSTGTTILSNYGLVKADNFYSVSGVARISVKKEGISGGTSSSSSTVVSSSGLSISKRARNVTQKSTYWIDVIYAEPGDEIEFLIEINSPKDRQAGSVRVGDELPPKLNYIPDSTTVDGYYEPDGIISKNIYIGEVYPYLTRNIKFKAKIDPASNFNLYPITLVNVASVWGSDGMEIKDTTKIIVRAPTIPSVKGVTISSTQPLSITKLGRNLSQNQTNWLDSVSAKPGEEVEFSIQISNAGDNNLTNVRVWDILPASLLIIENSTNINGVSWGGDVTGSGLNLGTLYRYETKTIKFRAKVASENKFSTGSTTLINTAYAKADNVSQISDPASVVVKKSGEVKGATFVPTGADLIALIFLVIISCFLAFLIYCRLRENKLVELLNGNKSNRLPKFLAKFYFRLKFLFTLKKIRFKKFYW